MNKMIFRVATRRKIGKSATKHRGRRIGSANRNNRECEDRHRISHDNRVSPKTTLAH